MKPNQQKRVHSSHQGEEKGLTYESKDGGWLLWDVGCYREGSRLTYQSKDGRERVHVGGDVVESYVGWDAWPPDYHRDSDIIVV
jgi:hypothetical protein